MEELTVDTIKKQHFDKYKENLLNIIENNTNILVNEDIKSLINKPPLDSMDILKNKFLDLSLKNKMVLKTLELSKLLDDYRNNLGKLCDEIKNERINVLSKKVNSFKYKDREVLIFYKKDFISLNRTLKKILKTSIINSYKEVIEKQINGIFLDDVDDDLKNKIINEFYKFINSNYQKQLLDSFDIKVLVKDTILINSINEQNDRYIFVLDNSRLFTIE